MKMRLLVTTIISAFIFGITPNAFAADVSAPVLVDWKLIDLKTDISNGDGILRIQFSVSDESDIEQPLSNVGSTTTTQQTGFAFPKLISKVGNVSTYSAEATVKFGQAPGLWRWLFFPMGDVIGNRSQGFGPGGTWPINVWVYDKDFTEVKRLATEADAKAKQEAEAKAAADLKAKQEAEAKAAADLKAKQEAEAKAAAELKAKQEAEAKAAAELKAKQEAEAAAKAAAAKKITITCVKGKTIKKVTAIKPKCPKGFKVKK
jgi:flagellar biosynthesis GTPase FlhF